MTDVSEEPAFIFKTKDSALKMEVKYYSETPVKLWQTERRQIPEAQTRYPFKREHRLFQNVCVLRDAESISWIVCDFRPMFAHIFTSYLELPWQKH
jgi:hypothetical protein